MGQCVGYGGDNPRCLTPGQPVFAQPSAELDAFQVVGNDIDLSLVHADVVNCHNPGVPQLSELARLTQ